MRIPHLKPSKIREMHGLAGPDSINLGLGQPVVETPPALIEIVQQVMAEDDLGYTGYAGLSELRSIIASKVCGDSDDEESVALTVGTTEGFFSTMMALIDSGDEVLIPNPGFVLYKTAIQIVGGQPVEYPTPAELNFQLDVEEIRNRITSSTKAVVINSPNNPTGRIIPESTLSELKALVEKHDLYLISDEVYQHVAFPAPAPSAWGDSDRVIVLNGVSKDLSMTGWRLGWIIASHVLIKQISAVHHYMVACAPTISQRILLRMHDNKQPGIDHLRNALLKEFARRKDILTSGISDEVGWDFVPPEGALYLMVKIPEGVMAGNTSEDIAKDLVRQQDLITIPGSAFGSQGEGYLRISFAGEEQTIIEGIQRLKRYAESGVKV